MGLLQGASHARRCDSAACCGDVRAGTLMAAGQPTHARAAARKAHSGVCVKHEPTSILGLSKHLNGFTGQHHCQVASVTAPPHHTDHWA